MNTPQAVLIGASVIAAAIVLTRPQSQVGAQSGQVGRYMGFGIETGIFRVDTMTGAIEACGRYAGGLETPCRPR